MRRRFLIKNRELEDFIIRFYPAGNYTWVVPGGCTEVDVFLVGGGGGSGNGSGAGSGYTKTYKRNNIGIKQGSQISVTPGQEINIIVGKGGAGLYYGYPEKGGFSQFMNSSYRADGGNPSGNGLLNGENSTGGPYTGGNGGSGGSVDQSGDEFYAGSDGSDAPGITDGNGIYHPPGTKYGGEKVKDIQPEILENRRVKEMPEVVELIEIGMVVWEVNPIMMKDVESEEETEKVVVTEEADAARKEPAVMELC